MKQENIILKSIYKYFKKNKLFLHEPIFSNKEKKNLANCLKSSFVSTSSGGYYVNKFSQQIKKFTKSRYAICTINGVSALHASLIALGIKKDEEVLVPSLTFVATIHPILYLGAVPHFVEVNNKNFGICFIKLAKYLKDNFYKKDNYYYNKITNRKITAIIAVHVFGNPCDIYELKLIAKKFNLKLIEDSAEALGSFYKKKHVGTFGEVGIFSFNGNKIITSGGGGIVVTNKKNIFKKILHLTANSKMPHKWDFIHDQIGFNYRMPNINASLVSAQFENLKKILTIKKRIFQIYKKIFSNHQDFFLLENLNKDIISNNWLNTIIIKNNKLNKNKLIKSFYTKKFFVRPVWKPLHTLKHLRKFPKMKLNITNTIYKTAISLPSGPGILK